MKHYLIKSSSIFLISIILGNIVAANVGGPINPLYQEAIRCWGNMKSTVYSHEGIVQEKEGLYEINCSFFIWYLMGNLVGDSERTRLPVEEGKPYCRASCFHDFFEALPDDDPLWQRVDDFRDIQIGDVIAWRVDTIHLKKNSGHVMIANSVPVIMDRDDGNWYQLEIIDSTLKPHFNDTRSDDCRAKCNSGLGIGTLHFNLDEAGRVIEFHSRPSDPAARYSFAIARIKNDLDFHLWINNISQRIAQNIKCDNC